MTTTPQKLLDELVAVFPEFKLNWESPRNCSRRDDGTFTHHGVFSEFTGFFKDNVHSLPHERIIALADFVNNCFASNDEDLSNAAATCFVENIAGENCALTIAPHFKGEVLAYFERWGGVPNDDIALREFLQRRRRGN